MTSKTFYIYPRVEKAASACIAQMNTEDTGSMNMSKFINHCMRKELAQRGFL